MYHEPGKPPQSPPREAINVGIEEGPHSLVAAMTIQPKARMGLGNDASIDNRFQTDFPGNGEALLAGLEGSPDKAVQEASYR